MATKPDLTNFRLEQLEEERRVRSERRFKLILTLIGVAGALAAAVIGILLS